MDELVDQIILGWPAIRTPAILLASFPFASAWAFWHKKTALAWILLAPPAAVIAFLAVAVLAQ
jgi:hypothetical protein